jgi:hypothetical protein
MKTKPAGRFRSAKLHIWIQQEASDLLDRYTKAFRVSKTTAIETMIDSTRTDVANAEQDERI